MHFDPISSRLWGVFQPYFWSGLGEFLGVIFYWKNVYLKHIYTVLCSLLLFTDSSQFSLTHRLPHKKIRRPVALQHDRHDWSIFDQALSTTGNPI